MLWITGLLAVIGASFVSGTRTETRLAYNQMENAKAEALADGGVQRAALRLMDPDPETAWHADRTVYTFALGEGDVQVQIEDEDGKIDLNVASIELVAGLFRAFGLDDDQAQTMAARIIDFRDEDNDPEPLGAEGPAYLEAGLDHGPDNRPFATESELVRVLGMTRSLYEQVRPCVTVYSGADAIDPTRAPRPVLEALPGITPPVVEALLTAGGEVDPLDTIEDQPGLADLW
ncbi:MAG: general secretion pathway protein GspK, partial [Geminicoccaceae bacterium]